MRKSFRTWLWLLVTLSVLVPLAFIATFLLTPLWSWIEATYGIESVGHSGPADWCFEAVYALFVSIVTIAWILNRRR